MCVSPDKERVTMKKSLRTTRPDQTLEKQLDQLKRLKADELRKRWHALFDSTPPPRLRSSLMVQAIARRLQEKAHGGLKPSTQRLLHSVAEEAHSGHKVSASTKKTQPRSGTVLVREWHGSKHQVSVLKEGFLYRSKRYSSLSQIARAITGTQWSGPLFFGLRSRSGHGRGAA
jgi:Protein of unknown function (DUF2924)